MIQDLNIFFFKQKTAYEIVSRDWSSDVCSSDLRVMKSLSRLMFVNLAVFYHTSLYIFCTGYGKRRVSFTACQSAHRHHI